MTEAFLINADINTIAEHSIVTSDQKHTLYVQEWGNPDGEIFLFLHGGPGGCCSDSQKTLFNTDKHRVIFVDQRGSGRSTPAGSLENNTTQSLVEDLEQIRLLLSIETWAIVGGSWGSTLALCYAIAYPSCVKNLIIRGIFLGSQAEADWLTKGGYKTFYPDVWKAFSERTPQEFRSDPGAYHNSRLNAEDTEVAKASLYAYNQVEYGLISLDDRPKITDYETFQPSSSLIEWHYVNQLCFIPNNYILNNTPKLTMPIYIIQGRYDMVCVPKFAFDLHEKLPNSTLHWTIAGHSGSDRANFDTTKAIISAI